MEGSHPHFAGGGDVGGGVVDEQAAVDWRPDSFGGDEVDTRVWLSDTDVGGVHHGVGEDVQPLPSEIRIQLRGRVGDQGDGDGLAGALEQGDDHLINAWHEVGPGGDHGAGAIH